MEASWFKQGSTAAGGFVLEDPGKLDCLCKSRLIFALQRAKKSYEGSEMQDMKKPLYRGSTLVKSELDVVLHFKLKSSGPSWEGVQRAPLWPEQHYPQGKSEQTLVVRSVKEHRRLRDDRNTLWMRRKQPQSLKGVGQEQKCQKWGRHSSGTTSSLMKFVQSLGKDERVQLT